MLRFFTKSVAKVIRAPVGCVERVCYNRCTVWPSNLVHGEQCGVFDAR